MKRAASPPPREIETIIHLVEDRQIPAVFCEENGETLTAQTVANETGAALYALTMGMGEGEMGCTDAIYKNIDTIREALS